MSIVAVQYRVQRRPRRRVFSPPTGPSSVSLSGTATFLVTELAQSSGKVPVLGYLENQSKALAQPSGKVSVLGVSSLQLKELANTPSLKAAITAFLESQSKSLAQPSGKVGLSALSAEMVKGIANIRTGGFAALVSILASMAKSSANTPNLKASLSALTISQAKATAQPSGSVGLLARAEGMVKTLSGMNTGGFASLIAKLSAMSKASASTPNLIASISALSTSQVKNAASPSGKVSLSARTASMAVSSGVISFISPFAALIGNIVFQTKAILFQPPTTQLTLGGRSEWTKKLEQYMQQRPRLLTFSEMGKMGGRPRKS